MELENFVKMSKYAGERFDLVQAGGGNTSVKMADGTMHIKASGFLLSDVETDRGYATVKTNDVANILSDPSVIDAESKRLRESTSGQLVKEATLSVNSRPSIETLLHSILLKYTSHTHSIAVNMITCKPDWKSKLKRILNTEEIALVDYETPGVELAFVLLREIKKFQTVPKIIFLQNHGLIITSDNFNEIENLTEFVLSKIERALSIDLSRYGMVNKISKFMEPFDDFHITFLSEDIIINQLLRTNKELFFTLPFCPDKHVFCGPKSLEITSLKDTKSVEAYRNEYHDSPKVVIFQDRVYIRAKNIKKAKEIEEVLKFHLITIKKVGKDETSFLEMDELAYLSNWEAEKFRQDL